jgi:hypothetical protein
VESNVKQVARKTDLCWNLVWFIFNTEDGGDMLMSVEFQRTTQHYVSEDGTLHSHRFLNLKSNILIFLIILRMDWSFFEKEIILLNFIGEVKPKRFLVTLSELTTKNQFLSTRIKLLKLILFT